MSTSVAPQASLSILSESPSTKHSMVSQNETLSASPVSDADSVDYWSNEDGASQVSSQTSVDQNEDQDMNDAHQKTFTIFVTEEERDLLLRMRDNRRRLNSGYNETRLQEIREQFDVTSEHPQSEGSPQYHEITGPSVFPLASNFSIAGGNFGAVAGNQDIRIVERRDSDCDSANDESWSDYPEEEEEDSADVQRELCLREDMRQPPSYDMPYRSAQMYNYTQVSEEPNYKLSGPTVFACARSVVFRGGKISPGAFCAVGGDQIIHA